MSLVSGWENFYVIAGSSAGALTGLTFVVISLISGARMRSTSWGVGAFTTPTIVHFSAVLLVSMILSAPWPALWQAGIVLAACGLVGAAYAAIVVRRLRRREAYDPLVEDWLWYATFPLAAYVALFVMAVLLESNPTPALFGIGAVMAALLLIGIRNAWDMVTYITIEGIGPQGERKDEDEDEDAGEGERDGQGEGHHAARD